MKTTVLKASKKLAEKISSDFISRKFPNGKPIFFRTEIANGFEISGKKKTGEIVVIFRYINDSGRQQFDYDEKLLTFN